MHPDHIGLAHWLCARWQVSLWVSATDYAVARNACEEDAALGGALSADFMQAHGWNDPADIARIRARSGFFRNLVPRLPPSYRRMQNDTHLRIGGRDWRCISGFGHAPEHLALYCAATGVLISGDMVLPRISTNVSVYPQEPEADALALFLASIEKFRALPADTLILPSHGKPFTGLHTRIDQLQAHHAARLDEVHTACSAAPRSAFDVLPVLFKRTLDFHQTTFAMGEAVAHLHWLWFQGQVQRTREPDGIYRFTTPADVPA
jgi:glyoxylase-like metal-dependent hydrolase (beta-lactamase superfamily II)